MTALAKSTGDSTACMPSIPDNNYVTQNKTGGKDKKKKKKQRKINCNTPASQTSLEVLHSFLLASEILSRIHIGIPTALKKFQCYLVSLPHYFKN